MRGVILVVLLGACGDDAAAVPDEANPLGASNNILPYPSSLYEVPDGTGIRLDVPVGAFPMNTTTDQAFDPTPLAKRRGWPASTTILWAVPGGVDPATLAGPHAIDTSDTPENSTLVLDMTTGQLVEHFSEVDANELDDPSIQAIYIRPMQRLLGGHRYAVGVRNTVKRLDGTDVPITDGFRVVLGTGDSSHPLLSRALPRLREAVAALATAGVAKQDLVVAWDFTVTPDEAAIADPVAARDVALLAMGTLGANLTYTVTSDLGTINGDPRLVRRIELDFEAPAVTGEAHAGYFRDAAGLPMSQGKMIAKAYVMVPPCATFNNKAGLLIYGHGFFGSLEELRSAEYVRDLAADGCLIVAGTQWVGMSNDDIPNALLALNDLNKGWGFGERIWQGMVNTIALEQLLRGKLATDLLIDAQGRSIADPSRVYFLGISLGHILGTTLVAYDPFITRAALLVGGANWSLMFERSANWSSYGLPLKGGYDRLLDAVIMEQVLQMALEGVDGATIAGVQIPRTPQKQILMMTSQGDTEVPNLASDYQARSLGLVTLNPVGTVPPGWDDNAVAGPSGRAWVNEDPMPLPPETNETFSYGNVAHENPRRRTLLQLQIRNFWSTGIAKNACMGTCECYRGECGTLRQAMYGGK